MELSANKRGGMPFVPNEMLAATGINCSDW